MANMPITATVNRQTATPIRVPRTRRRHALPVLTSLPAGKIVPVAAMGLLREDAVVSCPINISCEMLETAELLMNRVFLHVTAYVVPWLAFERFEGSRDQFDRSYMGQAQIEGGTVVPFFDTHAMGAHGSKPVYKYLGLHGDPDDEVNTMFVEAYNAVVNFRRKNRSPNLTTRTALDTTLAEAFWPSSRFDRIVPTFDEASMEGEVPLTVVAGDLALSAAAAPVVRKSNASVWTAKRTGTNTAATGTDVLLDGTGQMTDGAFGISLDPGAGLEATLTGITAELAANGIVVSLANIEMARKTQVFAALRKQYNELPEEYLMDMLMSGLRIPDLAMTQPILCGESRVAFSQVKRYATDSGNLAESAVSGGASVAMRLRVPQLSTGGVLMVFAEAVPEQIFERQRDPFFHLSEVEGLPEFVRDFGDPQKVDTVLNADIDTDHATPTGVFGFEPLNDRFNRFGPRIGGKFLRPASNTTEDEERQRLWAMEKVNPALSADFYIVSAVHQKPFLDLESDPFELTLAGQALIEGNTQFGRPLIEAGATDDYEAIAAKIPTDRIDQTP